MKKLLFKGIMYCIALTVGIVVLPATGIARTPGYNYQQGNPVKTVLGQIAEHYKVNIAYENSLLENLQTTYQFRPGQTNLQKVLQELLEPLRLKVTKLDSRNYTIVSSQPSGSKKTVEATAMPVAVDQGSSQQEENSQSGLKSVANVAERYIKGRVISEDGEKPIPGASITLKGSGVGTTTDPEGYFSLRVLEARGTLIVGHVNYFQQEVKFDNHNYLPVKLKVRVKEMSEVTVNTGMFKRTKENFTGAATVITGDQLRQVNSVNLLQGLKVLDPAIRLPDNIDFGSDPNRLPEITMRGTNNFPQQTTSTAPSVSGADYTANWARNPNQPLFILDGFEVSLQKIYDLDLNRVASITTLKDAAATAIYGSRAANGVIVIDTKQPLPGKLRVSYRGMMQIAAPDLTVYDLTNAAEKLEVERKAGVYSQYADGVRPDADAVLRDRYAARKAAVERGVNTDWLAQPVRLGYGQRQSIALEGGDNSIRYGLDLGYFNNAGVMKNSGRSTYTGGMNFSYRNKGLLFKNVLTVDFNKAVNSNYGSFRDYAKMNPYWNPYDSNGNLVKVLEVVTNPTSPTAKTSYSNPLYNTTLNTVDQTQYTNIVNQTNIDWLVGSGFRLKGKLQVEKEHNESDVFLPAQHSSFVNENDFTKRGSYTKGAGKFLSFSGNLQLDYNRKLGNHLLMGSAGSELMQTKSEFQTVKVLGFPNDKLDQISFGNGYPPDTRPEFYSTVTRTVSAYTNFAYSYKSRFNVDASIRTDGSSQFGSRNRFGTFWSTGASWNLHRESFLARSKYINLAKLRASVGVTGDNKFESFMGLSTYKYYTDQNYRGQVGAILAGFGNENLKWQQTRKQNIGLDMAVLNNRVVFNVDFYQENTTNLVLDITTPPSVGFGSYNENVGELVNKGFEFNVKTFLLSNEKKRVYWSVNVNGLHNRDHIKQISNSLKKLNQENDANSTDPNSVNYNKQTKPQFRFEEGQSVNDIWAVRSLGIDPSNGREVFLKKDGTITYNWDVTDKVVVGNKVPDMRGNFGTDLTWKGLTMGVYFSFEFGGQLYNQTMVERVELTDFTYNVDRRVLLGRWAKPGDVTYFKGLADENGRSVTTPTNMSSRFVQTNNFVEVSSINIGYNFSDKLTKRLGLSNTRVNFITNNITRWSAIQVERGLDYPFARTFTVNISTGF